MLRLLLACVVLGPLIWWALILIKGCGGNLWHWNDTAHYFLILLLDSDLNNIFVGCFGSFILKCLFIFLCVRACCSRGHIGSDAFTVSHGTHLYHTVLIWSEGACNSFCIREDDKEQFIKNGDEMIKLSKVVKLNMIPLEKRSEMWLKRCIWCYGKFQ